jgi:signal transduction histidine kinase
MMHEPIAIDLPAEILAGFLESIFTHVAIVNREGIVIAVNRHWRDVSQKKGGRVNAGLGLNYLDVCDACSEVEARAVGQGLQAVLEGRLDSFQHEYPCLDEWFRCLVTPLHWPVNSIFGAAVMHLDITERKQAEERALAANRAKSEFLAGFSHELRTPLNAVLGFSELLMMRLQESPRYKGYAEDIHRAGSHLLSLINDILDLSKVEAGRYDLSEQSVSLPALIEECAGMMAPRAQSVGLSLEFDLSASPPSVWADERLLRQMILNLLTNAIKFTLNGGTVTVAARRDADGDVLISIADTGIGIAPDEIGHVLEPFRQTGIGRTKGGARAWDFR